jgi:hypothetical protein
MRLMKEMNEEKVDDIMYRVEARDHIIIRVQSFKLNWRVVQKSENVMTMLMARMFDRY